MARNLRHRFWLESVLGLITIALALATLVWHDWIESVFGVHPDGGSGAVEWMAVLTLLVLSGILTGAARHEWRRAVRVLGED